MTDTSLYEKLHEFMENEARSCSMDFGCVTPDYVYRSFGGSIPLEETGGFHGVLINACF